MATPREREQPWSLDEKNSLLAEIIKAQRPHTSILLTVIQQMGITSPNWYDIPMPPGRSVNAGMRAFDDIRRPQATPMIPGSFPTQTPSPLSGHVPVTLGKRSYYESNYPSSREIRPKPSTTTAGYGQMSTIERPPKKKRGRPPKVATQAKAEAQTVSAGITPRSEDTGPPSAGLAGPQIVEVQTPVAQTPVEQARPILPPPSRMPISSILTPSGPPSAVQSSSSSSKRKRGRSTRSDPEHFPISEAEGARQGEGYESPYYGRPSLESQDTPARAAVLRHRDETETGFRQQAYQAHDPQPPSTFRPESDPK